MKEEYSGRNIYVREATPNDVDDMAAIRRAAWLATYPDETIGITQKDIETKVNKDLSANNRRSWADMLGESNVNKKWLTAEVDGRLAGYVFVHKSNGAPVVQALNVHPDYFGAGVGQYLLESGISWLGEGDIELGVVKHNARAIKFYERNGFVIDGEAHDEAVKLFSGKVMLKWRMVRTVE